MLLRRIRPTPGAHVVEMGCATGQLTRELARRFDDKSRISGFDESEAFINEARTRMEGAEGLRAPITLRVGAPAALPADDASADLVVSNLEAAAVNDPGAAVEEMARVLAPGGGAILTAPLRGTWQEFLDLFRDVLRESGKVDRLALIDRYVASLPDAARVTSWLEQPCGSARISRVGEVCPTITPHPASYYSQPIGQVNDRMTIGTPQRPR